MRLTILIIAAAGMLLFASGASAASIRECGSMTPARGISGSPLGILNLTTRNVGCWDGAFPFARHVTQYGRSWHGFACRTRLYSSDGSPPPNRADIRCTRGAQVIHWQIGD